MKIVLYTLPFLFLLTNLQAQENTIEKDRKYTPYDIPGFDNAHSNDPWNLWAWRGGLSGEFSASQNRDVLPTKGELFENDAQWSGQTDWQVFRVARSHRYSGVLLVNLFGRRENSSVGGLQKKPNIMGITTRQNLVVTPWKHAGFGFSAGLNYRQFRPLIGSNQDKDFFADAVLKLEFNLYPYQDFFRRYWLVRLEPLYIDLTRVEDFQLNKLALISEFSYLTKFGYWGGQLDAYATWTKEPYSRGNIFLGGRSNLAINLRQNLFLILSPRLSYNFIKETQSSLNFPNQHIVRYRTRQFDYELQWGLNWYFGRGRANVLNPRIW